MQTIDSPVSDQNPWFICFLMSNGVLIVRLKIFLLIQWESFAPLHLQCLF